MRIKNISETSRAFVIEWHDDSSNEFPFIWLRDNDPYELHPDTHERTFDLTSVALDIVPGSHSLNSTDDPNNPELVVSWPGKTSSSRYSAEWLYAHRPGHSRFDAAITQRHSWRATQMPELPRYSAAQCANTPNYLLDTLKALQTHGIVLIDKLEDHPQAGERFGDLIGFKRETNYGVMFEAKSKPNPNNLAYTALALPLHTDLSNQEFVPGNQFLHCFRNSASGGGSVFADGMAIIDEFQRDCPEHFELLTTLQVPWRFIDDQDDVRQHRPVIGLRCDGSFKSLTFNAHLADIADFEPAVMVRFYAGFRALMARIRDPKYAIEYTLKPGEMAVFNNQRVLHGRASFDPDSGERHLRGYYIEHNEINSRIRMLAAPIKQKRLN
jgi:gamma-butyrobetaine dioxygenase